MERVFSLLLSLSISGTGFFFLFNPAHATSSNIVLLFLCGSVVKHLLDGSSFRKKIKKEKEN